MGATCGKRPGNKSVGEEGPEPRVLYSTEVGLPVASLNVPNMAKLARKKTPPDPAGSFPRMAKLARQKALEGMMPSEIGRGFELRSPRPGTTPSACTPRCSPSEDSPYPRCSPSEDSPSRLPGFSDGKSNTLVTVIFPKLY